MKVPGFSAASTRATHFVGLDAGATHLRTQAFWLSGSQLAPAGPVYRAKFPAYQQSPGRSSEMLPWQSSNWEQSPERAAGIARADLAVELVAQASRGFQRVAIAAAWPGLKCSQGDSIVYAVNGPRVHNLRQHLETGLVTRGLPLVLPVPSLQSDGDMAGWGEELAPQGAFRDVERAYLLLVGTGLAEAFKVAGEIVSRAHFASSAAPYAMFPPGRDRDFEKYLCAAAWLACEDGLSRQERIELLRTFLVKRLELAPFEAIVLGGRFTQILTALEVEVLAQGGLPVRLSRLQDPALWGCAAYSLSRQK